jgi:hypothetical protein
MSKRLLLAVTAWLHLHAVAAPPGTPLVCNAAETAKVCKVYNPKLDTDSPEERRFLSALEACAGPDNYGQSDDDAHPGRQKRYSDCQDDPTINALRLKSNEVGDAIRKKHDWYQRRCDPRYASTRVCGTSPADQAAGKSNATTGRTTERGPILTAVDPKAEAERQAAAQRKADAARDQAENERLRQVAKARADEELQKVARDAKDRDRCLARGNTNDCGCARFFPSPPPPPGVARTCSK